MRVIHSAISSSSSLRPFSANNVMATRERRRARSSPPSSPTCRDAYADCISSRTRARACRIHCVRKYVFVCVCVSARARARYLVKEEKQLMFILHFAKATRARSIKTFLPPPPLPPPLSLFLSSRELRIIFQSSSIYRSLSLFFLLIINDGYFITYIFFLFALVLFCRVPD